MWLMLDLIYKWALFEGKSFDISGRIRYSCPTRSNKNNFMKTNKSFAKRIKVTKNGKLVARKPGQNHFNARQTGQQRLRRKRTQLLNLSKRITRRFLPGTGAKPLSETNPVVEAK